MTGKWLDGSMLTYSNFDVGGGYPKKTESQIGAVFNGITFWSLVYEIRCNDATICVLYRAPKTQSLIFPSGGTKAPLLLVESVDQSSLYPSIGPKRNELETGEKVYLKPINISTNGMAGFSGQPIIMLNSYKRKVKVKPVIVSQTETEMSRNLKEKEETEDSMNMKAVQNGGGSNGNGSSPSLAEEMNSNSKAKREREENESVRSKTIQISRG
ncbi:hypothetical protein CAEBREN_30461 [Caenorhabditis brenneri]|uniref:Uncharacterized protein n=1 Tax=Caenorhabditis brenneri TaxID=135651 RepID=G0MK91_CAEBE|nr:hypothetical protein CAEBREN_30461 [Caenorhabditis brenneri]